jgi:hypothetical protein
LLHSECLDPIQSAIKVRKDNQAVAPLTSVAPTSRPATLDRKNPGYFDRKAGDLRRRKRLKIASPENKRILLDIISKRSPKALERKRKIAEKFC